MQSLEFASHSCMLSYVAIVIKKLPIDQTRVSYTIHIIVCWPSWPSSSLSTGCAVSLRGDWAIFYHSGSRRVGRAWSARAKSLEIIRHGWELLSGPGPQGGQTVSYFTELSWLTLLSAAPYYQLLPIISCSLYQLLPISHSLWQSKRFDIRFSSESRNKFYLTFQLKEYVTVSKLASTC